ncbi:MAG: Rieske 2Fe-2S domain-containing protein [Limnobacter sp.]|nr:Rieske 2Fe-2S domain-containing protein [Limnobacter sp.]
MIEIALCPAAALQEGGLAHRFKVLYNGEHAVAFVLRVNGAVHAYLNRCSHVPVELDWNYGEFLDDSGSMIVCATHGASYNATNGHCIGGPCDGKPLIGLHVFRAQ